MSDLFFASRSEDMSPNGRLNLIWQPDGDLIVECVDNDGESASVEFCNSGGQSPRTLRALRILILAMQADSAFAPYGMDKDGIESSLREVGTKLQAQVRAKQGAKSEVAR